MTTKQTWTFPSSSGTAVYTAHLADDGKLLCDCRGWTMKKANAARHCKHTKQIVAEMKADTMEKGEFTYLVVGYTLTPKRRADWCGTSAVIAERRTEIADLVDRVSPMLASPMVPAVTGAAFNKRFATGWIMEEKLDGHRVVAVVGGGQVKAHSRPRADGKARARELPDHIVEQLLAMPDGTYDGELMAPSGKSWEVVRLGTKLVFVIFDVLQCKGVDLTGDNYEIRRSALLKCLGFLPAGQQAISSVHSVKPTWAAVEAIWKRGGEGVILKKRESLYRPGHRSDDWIKVKKVQSAVLTITGYEAGKAGPYSVVALLDKQGKRATVKTLDNATLRAIAKNPDSFIGRKLVISYQEQTASGSFRHAMWDYLVEVGE
jgi:ATP-dependent DNA ligase